MSSTNQVAKTPISWHFFCSLSAPSICRSTRSSPHGRRSEGIRFCLRVRPRVAGPLKQPDLYYQSGPLRWSKWCSASSMPPHQGNPLLFSHFNAICCVLDPSAYLICPELGFNAPLRAFTCGVLMTHQRKLSDTPSLISNASESLRTISCQVHNCSIGVVPIYHSSLWIR